MSTPNFQPRNEAIRACVDKLLATHPHWKYEYVLEKTAEKFFLSARTIEAIVKGEGVYA